MIARALLATLVALANNPVSGAIYLTTLPTGADAWVDGGYVGRSPVLVDALAPGKHMVTIAKTGWESRELEVGVNANLPFQFIDLQLQRSAKAPRTNGKLAIHARGSIDSISIDGAAPLAVPSGATIELEPGPHEIAIHGARGRIVRHVVIYPETTTNVVLRGSSGNEEDRAVVVAPATQYLAPSDVTLEGKRIAIRHNGHAVSGMLGDPSFRIDGETMTFDSAPTLVGGKLYLPLDLYMRIGAVPIRAR